MTEYFGAPVDAPAWDGATQVSTPAGQLCQGCGEEIFDGDRGWVLPHLDRVEGGMLGVVGTTAIHAECMLASVIGHDHGACGCHEGGETCAAAQRLWADITGWDIAGQPAATPGDASGHGEDDGRG